VLPLGQENAELLAPDGTSTALVADADGVVLVPALDRAGVWRIRITGAEWLALRAIALDPRLGDLSQATTGEREAATVDAGLVERQRTPAERMLPLVLTAVAAACAWLLAMRGR